MQHEQIQPRQPLIIDCDKVIKCSLRPYSTMPWWWFEGHCSAKNFWLYSMEPSEHPHIICIVLWTVQASPRAHMNRATQQGKAADLGTPRCQPLSGLWAVAKLALALLYASCPSAIHHCNAVIICSWHNKRVLRVGGAGKVMCSYLNVKCSFRSSYCEIL
jgi:hypothetical protein